MAGRRREMRQLVARLEALGWRVNLTGGGHYRARGPRGQIVFMPQSPSDYRAYRNTLADLRRTGASV